MNTRSFTTRKTGCARVRPVPCSCRSRSSPQVKTPAAPASQLPGMIISRNIYCFVIPVYTATSAGQCFQRRWMGQANLRQHPALALRPRVDRHATEDAILLSTSACQGTCATTGAHVVCCEFGSEACAGRHVALAAAAYQSRLANVNFWAECGFAHVSRASAPALSCNMRAPVHSSGGPSSPTHSQGLHSLCREQLG